MPSLDDIFGVLTASDKQIAEDDPYSGYGDVATQVLQQVFKPGGREVETEDSWGRPLKMRTAAPTIGESLIAGLVGGATKGFFGGLSDDYRAEQSSLATRALTDALGGGEITRPEGLSANIWAPIERQASAFRLGQKLSNEAEDKKFKRDLQKELLLERVKNPYTADLQDEVLAQALGRPAPAKPIAETAADREAAQLRLPATQKALGLQGEALAGAAPTAAAPATRDRLDQLMRDFRGEKTAATEQLKYERELPRQKEEDLEDLQQRFSRLPEVQDFIMSDTGIRSLRRAMADTSGGSDLELTRGAIQAIEPGMAVREGEERAARNSGSIPAAWYTYISGALTGQTKLPADVRQGLMNIAERRWLEHADNFNLARAKGQETIQRRGLPGDISWKPEANQSIMPREGTTATPAAAEVPPGMVLQRNQKTGETRLVPK